MSDTLGYRRPQAGEKPDYLFPPYASSVKRSPRQSLVLLPHTLSELTGPIFGYERRRANDADLTRQHANEPLGERIIVSGRVLDDDGRALPNSLVEIRQPNAAGRYAHRVDTHNAPLDPNFTGCGRFFTDEEGRYRFVTIKPGAYPWGQSSECLATGAYPFFALWPGARNATCHADVFPG